MGEGGRDLPRDAERRKWGRGSLGSRSGLLCDRKRTGVGLAGHEQAVKPAGWRTIESCSLTPISTVLGQRECWQLATWE